MGQDYPLARGQAAQALVPGGRRQPGTNAIGVLDPVDVLKQAQPSGLGDIGRIALRQLEFRGDRPDEPGVLLDQAFPRPPVPGRGTAYEPRDVGGASILLGHPCPRLPL